MAAGVPQIQGLQNLQCQQWVPVEMSRNAAQLMSVLRSSHIQNPPHPP